MKNILRSFGKQVLFWFLFFAFARITFLIYYHKFIGVIDVISVLAVFWHALRLDLSTVCYIMMFPVLVLGIQSIISRNWMNKVILIYHSILIFIYSLITSSEIGIYEEWQTKLGSKAIKYLSNPGEIYNSASTGVFFFLLFILLVQFFAGFLAYRKWFFQRITCAAGNFFFTVIFFTVSLIMIGIGLRGGLQQIPINQSVAYFSKHNILNLTAVNSGWNMIHSLHQNFYSLNKNPFQYFNAVEAEKIVEGIHKIPKDTTIQVLKTKNPNIVLIILEGWSADLVESLGGEKGITPRFKEFEKNGILFSNIYASGTRSEEGMSAIFGGFPSMPLAQISRQPDKFIKLPSLTQQLISKGYHTSFYFGGDLSYGNMRGYIYYNNFEKIIESSDFNNDVPRGKLGIHDEFVYRKLLEYLNKEKTPFFSAYFTLSSHSPYDIPDFKENIQWPELEKKYVNAAYYSDSCLGDFISNAKKQKWFSNTLFVIVADHGHGSYKAREYWSPAYNKIPLLLYGDVIKDESRGTICDKIGSQVDVAATLLHQLGFKSNNFNWSKNMLNPYSPGFAYYAFEVGFGWVCSDGEFVFEHNMKKFLEEKLPANKKDSTEKVGKTYLQQVYQEYWDY